MRIQELTLYTSQLEKQKLFYRDTLEFNLIQESEISVSFQVGKSILAFEYREDATPYHFAINIPSNQEELALKWLKARVEILKDASFEIQDFENWNAKAIYFYDADQNIVEFIARKNLNNWSGKAFDASALMEISEIGVPSDRIQNIYSQITEHVMLEIYDGGFERFCALGDEHGLFICINKNVKDWFPTNDKAYSSEFHIKLSHHDIEVAFQFVNGYIIRIPDRYILN
ncbi:VOC family protein [bacterium SCSIO 12643]|nr:VOC family protein [bacterium SCSIO 12643]